MITASDWQWANDSPVWLKPRRTVYFLVRHVGENHANWSDGKIEYRRNKRGALIAYNNREQAIRIVERLNRERIR